MRYLRIMYPALPPVEFSLNGSQVHWRKKHAANLEVRETMMALLNEQGHNAKFNSRENGQNLIWRAKVTLTVTFPVKRKRDDDNLRARCKPILDSLVHWGVLADDSYENIGRPEIIPVVQRGASQTLIEVQETK